MGKGRKKKQAGTDMDFFEHGGQHGGTNITYDFSAMYDVQALRRTEKRLAGMESIMTRPLDKVIKGIVYRGQKSVLRIDSNNFLCEGELFLFGSILAEFFRLYGTINSFHLLEVINTSNNEIFKWEQKTSLQRVI